MKINFKTVKTLCVILSWLSIAGCKEEKINGEGRTGKIEKEITNSYSKIEVDAPISLTIFIDSTIVANKINFSGYENLIEKLKIDVVDGTLKISFPPNYRIQNEPDLKAEITVKSLELLELSDAANAEVKGIIKVSNFDIVVTGASEILLAGLYANKCKVDATGAAEIKIKAGFVNNFQSVIEGASQLDALQLMAAKADLTIDGAGENSISVRDTLIATVAGAGTVSYKGNPIHSSITTSGAGTVTQLDSK